MFQHETMNSILLQCEYHGSARRLDVFSIFHEKKGSLGSKQDNNSDLCQQVKISSIAAVVVYKDTEEVSEVLIDALNMILLLLINYFRRVPERQQKGMATNVMSPKIREKFGNVSPNCLKCNHQQHV